MLNPPAVYISLVRIALMTTYRQNSPGAQPFNAAYCAAFKANDGGYSIRSDAERAGGVHLAGPHRADDDLPAELARSSAVQRGLLRGLQGQRRRLQHPIGC